MCIRDSAYVTLRAGNECVSSVNRMDVIDLADITQPVIRRTYSMLHPYGLSIRDSILYVCEGESGLKVFDAINALNPVHLKTLYDIHAWDVIAFNDLLMVIGEEGLNQYTVAGIDHIEKISTLPVADISQ